MNASPTVSSQGITTPRIPVPPDISSREPSATQAIPDPPSDLKPQEPLTLPNQRVQLPDSPKAQSSVDTRLPETESSPVSPSIQETPGVPVGYVAGNSRFLAIRMPAGSQEATAQANEAIRIGQLIYSPQAVYPEHGSSAFA